MVSTGAGQAHPRGCKIRNGHTAFKDGFWCQGWIADLFKRADRVWESISVYKGLALKTQGPEFDPQYPCNNQETVVVIPTLQKQNTGRFLGSTSLTKLAMPSLTSACLKSQGWWLLGNNTQDCLLVYTQVHTHTRPQAPKVGGLES